MPDYKIKVWDIRDINSRLNVSDNWWMQILDVVASNDTSHSIFKKYSIKQSGQI